MEKNINDQFNDELLMKCYDKYGHDENSLKEIGGFESFIYEYRYLGKAYILRITHSAHRSLEMIEAEIRFVQYLHENGCDVACAVLSKSEKLAEKVELNEKEYFIVTSFFKVEGTHIQFEQITPLFISKWGKTIGKFHQLTKSYLPGKYRRFDWKEDGLYRNYRQYVPEEQIKVTENISAHMKRLSLFTMDKDNYGLIHTDVHSGNFFVSNGNMTVFDFDDCAYNWFSSDIAISLFYTVFNKNVRDRNEFAKMFFHHFMSGYATENQLSHLWINRIPEFIKLREMILYVAIYRSLDIDHLPPWPSFFMEGRKESIENCLNILDIDIFN